MKSIKERILEQNGIVTLEMTLDEFAYSVVAPKTNDEFVTEYDIKVGVVDVTYYKESQLCIVRLKAL